MTDAAHAYVVMAPEGGAYAACVIDGSPIAMVREFLSEHAGGDIRRVTVAEARELIGRHFAAGDAAEAARPVQGAML